MGSIFGKKVCTKPLCEASSDRPESPVPIASNSKAMSNATLSPAHDVKNPDKNRGAEAIFETYMVRIRQEREIAKQNRDEEDQCREERRQQRDKEGEAEHTEMHEDQMTIQQSIVEILRTLDAEE